MKTSSKGRQLIEQFEGLQLTVYADLANKKTIGYGHLMKPDEHFTRITVKEAEQILSQDLRFAEQAVNQLVKIPLQQCQFDALISFTFNLGCYVLQRSTLLLNLNQHHIDVAADEFLRWIYVNKKPCPGLLKRRQAERSLFLFNHY